MKGWNRPIPLQKPLPEEWPVAVKRWPVSLATLVPVKNRLIPLAGSRKGPGLRSGPGLP